MSAAISIPVSRLKAYPGNPRTIDRKNLDKLKQSIQEFPEMLEKRPLVVVSDGDKFQVLGGNMRYRAAKELGISELPCILADDFTEAQRKEFVIKDNLNAGAWDMDALANEWEASDLVHWGFDLPELEEMAEELIAQEKKPEFSIKITCMDGKQVTKIENDVKQVLRNYPGASYSVSSGGI